MKLKTKNRSHRYDINRPTIADKIYETMSRNQAKLDKTRNL